MRHDHKLYCRTQRRPTLRGDVISFFDELTVKEHSVPSSVVLYDTSFHNVPQIEKCRREWMVHELLLLLTALTRRI